MHVLIPIKDLNFAKQRLASLLSIKERRLFFQAMLHDVLSVLNKHPLISGITLVSDDPSTQVFEQLYQLNYISQASLNVQGLSNTVKVAMLCLAESGVKDAMILHGDLPLINVREITELIEHYVAAEKPTIILSPDRHSKGTNCILCPTQSDFEFHYGEQSLEKHSQQAISINTRFQVMKQDGIACDIDHPHDLLQFLSQVKGKTAQHTQEFLREYQVIDRLLQQAIELTPATQPSQLAAFVNHAITQGHKNYAT